MTSTLNFYPNKSDYLLEFETKLKLNCSLIINKSRNDKEAVSILLQITDDDETSYNTTQTVLSNDFYGVYHSSITYNVMNDENFQHKTFYCVAKVNETSYKRFTNVIYESK